MIKKSLTFVCIAYLFFVLLISFVFLQNVTFLLFGDKWWQYIIDSIQAIGSLATALTLIWIIYDRYKDRKEKELEKNIDDLSSLATYLMGLCNTEKLHENFKILNLIYRIESKITGIARCVRIDDQLSFLCSHINQTTKSLPVEYLIGVEEVTTEFPSDIYINRFVDELTMLDFKRRVLETAFMISKNKKYKIFPVGDSRIVIFETNIDIDMLNKLVIFANPFCKSLLERTADICWLQQELKNINHYATGLDVAAYIYVLNHENGKALVKEFNKKYG